MLHCTWMVCWTANDTHLFRANCFPTDRVISNWNRCSHIHWPIYLLHWNMDQNTEIRSYIKCRIRLNIDLKQIFNELCGIYGPQTISMRTVFRWVKAFKDNLPSDQTWRRNMPSVHVIIKYQQKSQWNARPRWLSWMRRPTGDQEVAGSTPVEVGNILSWRLIMKYFLRSFSPFRWFKKGSCQFLAKECAQYWLTAERTKPAQ